VIIEDSLCSLGSASWLRESRMEEHFSHVLKSNIIFTPRFYRFDISTGSTFPSRIFDQKDKILHVVTPFLRDGSAFVTQPVSAKLLHVCSLTVDGIDCCTDREIPRYVLGVTRSPSEFPIHVDWLNAALGSNKTHLLGVHTRNGMVILRGRVLPVIQS
jgi:hypothetical protein